MKPSISVIGTGRMGSAIANAFLKGGYATTVWNRTRSKAEPLAANGARVAGSVLEAAAADVVVVVVSDYATSDGLLRADGVVRALRGKTIVQLTSGSPRLAREAAQWAEGREISYIDGAIMATPDFIGQEGTTILYAGAKGAFDRHESTLRALGGNTAHVGEDVGHASALDSAILSFLWGELFGVLQGLVVAKAEGISIDTFAGFVNATRPVIEGAVADLTERVKKNRLLADEGTLAGLDSHYGALKHLIELCEERGIDHTVPAAFGRLFQKAVDAGHGQEDFAVLAKVIGGRVVARLCVWFDKLRKRRAFGKLFSILRAPCAERAAARRAARPSKGAGESVARGPPPTSAPGSFYVIVKGPCSGAPPGRRRGRGRALK